MSERVCVSMKRKKQFYRLSYSPVFKLLDFCYATSEVFVFDPFEGHDLKVIHVDVERVRFVACVAVQSKLALGRNWHELALYIFVHI